MRPNATKQTQKVIDDLNEQGYSKIENCIPRHLIISLWQDIHKVGMIVADRFSMSLAEFNNPSQTARDFLSLSRKDRNFISVIYDQCKQLPSFLQLSAWQGFSDIYSSIYGTSVVGIGENSYGVRFDLPHEEKFSSHWHQEYATNPQSPEGLVFWIPLADILEGMGSVEIMKGSNKGGFIEHKELDKYSFKSGLYKLGIPIEQALMDKYPIDRPLSKMGDLILMRFDTVHQSGKNISERLRVTLQVRYFGFDNPEAASRFWPSKPSDFFCYNVSGKK